MNIYLKMMFSLSILFTFFSILVYPIMSSFKEGTAYQHVEETGNEVYSLGSLGYSQQICMSQPIDVGVATISCSYGVIGQIFDFGLNDFSTSQRTDVCTSTDATEVCKPNNPASLDELRSF